MPAPRLPATTAPALLLAGAAAAAAIAERSPSPQPVPDAETAPPSPRLSMPTSTSPACTASGPSCRCRECRVSRLSAELLAARVGAGSSWRPSSHAHTVPPSPPTPSKNRPRNAEHDSRRASSVALCSLRPTASDDRLGVASLALAPPPVLRSGVSVVLPDPLDGPNGAIPRGRCATAYTALPRDMTALPLERPEWNGEGDLRPTPLPFAVQPGRGGTSRAPVTVTVASLVLPPLPWGPGPTADGGPSLDGDDDNDDDDDGSGGVGKEDAATTPSVRPPSSASPVPPWHGSRLLLTPSEPDPVAWRRAMRGVAPQSPSTPRGSRRRRGALFGPTSPDAHPSRVPCPESARGGDGGLSACLSAALTALRPTRIAAAAGAGPLTLTFSSPTHFPPTTRHTLRARRGRVFVGMGDGAPLSPDVPTPTTLHTLSRPTEATVVVLSTPPEAISAASSDHPLAMRARMASEAHVARKAVDASTFFLDSWQPLGPLWAPGAAGRCPALSAPVYRHTRLGPRGAAYLEGARL